MSRFPAHERLKSDLTEPSVLRHAGWIMLLIAAATIFMSAPGQSFSVAAFVDPMIAALSTSRTDYSVAYMVATLCGGLALPFVGRLVDRLGARLVLPVVALMLGLACSYMSQLTTVAGLYLGFTLIRCLGQGSLTLISNWIIGEWFQQRRGLAAGLCALGGTASVLIVPLLNNYLIDTYGWRQTWVILGVAVAGVLVVPAAVFLRDRPELMGLLPDLKFRARTDPGPDGSMESKTEQHVVAGAPAFTVGEAIRFSSFWKIASVVATVSLVGTGLMFHQVSLLASRNVSREMALAALSVQAVAATVSTLIAGYLTDRVPPRFVLAASMALEIVAITMLLFLPSPRWALVYSAVLGLHGGIIRSAGSVIWINYFGRRHQGAIQGVSMSIMVLAAALGPVPLARAFDMTGNYESALWAFLILPSVAGVAVLSAVPPENSDPTCRKS